MPSGVVSCKPQLVCGHSIHHIKEIKKVTKGSEGHNTFVSVTFFRFFSIIMNFHWDMHSKDAFADGN